MTVENCIKLLEAYKKQAENPVDEHGTPYTGDMRNHSMLQSKANVEMMKNHILTSKKFREHPILDELKETPVQETKPKEKKDGKKSKG